MKLIKPSVEYIPQPEGLDGVYKQIERCARTCYKSEDRITKDSAKKMVDGLIKAGHGAMLEHGTVYLGKLWSGSVCHFCNQTMANEFIDKYAMNPYSKVVVHNNDICVSTNYRVLVENEWLDDLQFLCNPTEHHIKRYTMKFICDRGVSHELVRHRVFSFAQESQRYCNYSKDKFDNGITFIKPSWCDEEAMSVIEDITTVDTEKASAEFVLWMLYLADAEKAYLKLLEMGWTPQQARGVLPNATKTEIILTGFEDGWNHFFNLRYYGITGKPHPDMQYIAKLAFDELESKSDYRYPRDNFYEGVIGTSFNKD